MARGRAARWGKVGVPVLAGHGREARGDGVHRRVCRVGREYTARERRSAGETPGPEGNWRDFQSRGRLERYSATETRHAVTGYLVTGQPSAPGGSGHIKTGLAFQWHGNAFLKCSSLDIEMLYTWDDASTQHKLRRQYIANTTVTDNDRQRIRTYQWDMGPGTLNIIQVAKTKMQNSHIYVGYTRTPVMGPSIYGTEVVNQYTALGYGNVFRMRQGE